MALTTSADSGDGSNYLDFGSYSTTGMRDEAELVWIATAEDFFWTATITGIKFGSGSGLTDAYTIDADKGLAMVDTGSTCTYIPRSHYSKIVRKILEDIDDDDQLYSDTWDYVVPCSVSA